MKFKLYPFLILMTFLSSCLFNNDQEADGVGGVASEEVTPQFETKTIQELIVDDSFNYQTTQEIELNLEFLLPNGDPISSVPYSLIDSTNQEEAIILNGTSDKKGKSEHTLILGGHIQEIWLKLNFTGLPSDHLIKLDNSVISHTIGGQVTDRKKSKIQASKRDVEEHPYQTLGSWDAQGVPNYLTTRDNIDSQLLLDINISLPEGKPVPTYNPQYLKDIDMNTKLQEEADLWVTFVHEGAGYKNTLGFFTYDLDNPPASVDEIGEQNMYLMFPNVSYSGSGGGLSSGDKVHLGRFPANTGIGWFLIPNGWRRNTQSVITSSQTKYSVQSMNDYAGINYRQYLIKLKDDARELLLLGFEDITRPGGDNDFNDAIFYVTANPYTAIVTEELETISTSVDSDNDGLHDYADEFPNDPTKAISTYTPAKNRYGSFAFEDLWPSQGDYDFNDLVLDYNMRRIMSADYEVKELELNFRLKAIGALYENGFGIELPIPSDKVRSVTGTFRNENFITDNANGCEAGHENAVIIIFDNASSLIEKSSGSNYTNVERGKPFVAPFEFTVRVTLDNNVYSNQLSNTPYNPFLIVDRNRSQEIHLAGHAPTAKADSAFFGAGDDRTDLSGKFYKTENNLPWAIHLSVSFEYPSEGKVITQSHLKFTQWAESSGGLYNDWYFDNQSYRNEVLIFKE